MRFQFQGNNDDDSVDPEYTLLRDDGSETGLSIQDARAYAGVFVVNEHGYDPAFYMRTLGEFKSLAKAKAFALAQMTVQNNG